MNHPAFDSTNSAFVLNFAKSARAKVAIWYSSLDGRRGWKILKTAEVETLGQESFEILPMFQYAWNKMCAFSGAISIRGGENALISANRFRLPRGATIVFADDFDAARIQESGHIEAYFGSVRATLENHAVQYRVGVRGSGLVCRMLHSEGLVELTWLAQSTGWREYSTYKSTGNWTLKQSATVSGNGADFNFDAVNGGIGYLDAFFHDYNGSQLLAGIDAKGGFLTERIQNAPAPEPHGPVSLSKTWPRNVFKKDGEHDESRVRCIQNGMNLLSYSPVSIDGDYVFTTANKVGAFQARSGDKNRDALGVDGAVGEHTCWALFVDDIIRPIAARPDPAKSDTENFVALILSHEGAREWPKGSNRGPSIDAYTQSSGRSNWKGICAWCFALVYWCADKLEELGNVENPLCKRAGVHKLWNKRQPDAVDVVRASSASSSTVEPGMVFFVDTAAGKRHAGIVVSVNGSNTDTIERNTDVSDSRKVVYRRTRKAKMGSLMGYLQFFLENRMSNPSRVR